MPHLDGAVITREQFLLREMRICCRLRQQGLSDQDIIDVVVSDNLFQYPTERMQRNIARVCTRRFNATASDRIESLIANGLPEGAAQANLYAMMCTYPLVREFMQNEVGRRYRDYDLSLGPMEMNAWVTRLMAEYSNIAQLTDSTVAKIKQVLRRGLVECGMLSGPRATSLQPFFAEPDVIAAIREKGDTPALAAFNVQEAK